MTRDDAISNESEPSERCLFALHEHRGRKFLACLVCGRPKPEPCYFAEVGERDRAELEGKE